MRTGTGILTRDDVSFLTGVDIWDEEITRCVTVVSLANTLSQLGISYTIDSAYAGSDSTYRLLPYNKVSFSSTPSGPTTYAFNIFGNSSVNSGMNSITFDGSVIIYQGSASAPQQNFTIDGNIYQTRYSVDLSYQGSTISETVFNQLYFFISGGWVPSYSCNCTIFKTQGTSYTDADRNKNTGNPIYQSTISSASVSTESSPCLLSSIGTYDEFKQGLLGIFIYLDRNTSGGGAALTISPTSWAANAIASSKTFTANNLNGTLSVFSKPTWATVSISGSSISVSITANTTGSARTGTIVFSGTGTDGSAYRPSVQINQTYSYSAPSISPTSKSVTSTAQYVYVSISNVTSIDTVSSTNSSWAYPVPANPSVFSRQIQISANTSSSSRYATVTYTVTDLAGASKTLTISISQSGQSTTSREIRLSSETEWTQDYTATISGYNVYKSNTISDSSWTILTLEVSGYQTLSPLDIYIRSYAESNYDYAVAYELDYIPEPSTYSDVVYNDSSAVAHTKGNQQSGTGLASYTKVSYTIPDNNTHYISVVYRKDYSTSSGDDAAYVAVPNEYMA